MHKTDPTAKNYLAPNAEIEKPYPKGNQTWSFWGPWWQSHTGKEKKEPSYNDSGKREIREKRATLARGDEKGKSKDDTLEIKHEGLTLLQASILSSVCVCVCVCILGRY